MNRDFHAVLTITLGELIEAGVVDWSKDEWRFDCYDEETRSRLCKKIENRYFAREISIVPPGLWRRRFIGLMSEIMPKYDLLYKKMCDDIDIFQNVDEYYKGRTIYSDFPQTSLGGNADYASTGQDVENERIVQGDVLDKIAQFESYKDVDVMVLDELEILFSSLITVNLNAF